MKLTQKAVDALSVADIPAGKGEVFIADDDVRAFGVRLRRGPGGAVGDWCRLYRFAGKQRRDSFGSIKVVPLVKARRWAIDGYMALKQGIDPRAAVTEARQAARDTFGATVVVYLPRRKANMKPRSHLEMTRHLTVHLKPLHGVPLAKLDRRAVASRLAEIETNSGPNAALAVRTSGSAFYNWCIREGLADANPFLGTNRPEIGEGRDRVLTPDEQRIIWAALPNDDYGDSVRLLALLARRRTEIGSLTWSEVDLDNAVITLPLDRVKNKRELIIPLNGPAFEILRRQPRTRRDGSPRVFVFGRADKGFTAWGRHKHALDQRLSLPDWVLHDWRRTFSTIMNDAEMAPPHIIEAVLGHVVGARGNKIGQVYNKARYQTPMKVALDRWAVRLLATVEGREHVSDNVRKIA